MRVSGQTRHSSSRQFGGDRSFKALTFHLCRQMRHGANKLGYDIIILRRRIAASQKDVMWSDKRVMT